MTRESAQTKGRRYLTEGRLVVTHVTEGCVRAYCRGGGALYQLGFDAPTHWWCDCPARVRCSHLVALQLVVAMRHQGVEKRG